MDEAILEGYISLWREFSLPKRQIMTAPGEIEKYLYFAVDGVQKSYFLHRGKEHIIAFAYAPSYSGIPESFFTQTPSRYYLETITDSRFLRISFEEHIEFLKENRQIETLFRKVLEIFLNGVIQRQHELMALSMEERFRVFMDRSGHLLQIIPQKDLASYLNTDATNFSKLMNRIRT